MSRNKTIVRIDGQDYTLAGEESVVYMHEVASLVDERMVELRKRCVHFSTAMTAVLAAVNIAEELFKEREKNKELMSKLQQGNTSSLPDNVKTITRSV